MAVLMRYPTEALVFRDKDPTFKDNRYMADGFHVDYKGIVDGLTVLVVSGSQLDRVGWVDADFLVPLTPAAREMLARAPMRGAAHPV